MTNKLMQFINFLECAWLDDEASMCDVLISQLIMFTIFVVLCGIAWGWMVFVY